jgi:methyltransferase (TIGR00027 family)
MTDQNGVENKPSETAMFAALRRAIANKDYPNQKFGPDYLADRFLPAHFRFFLRFKRVRENTKEKLNGFLPGLNEYMIARTAYFDGLFVEALKARTPQIVLLGAGYDTRAYRFSPANQGTRIFELDILPTQNQKLKYLRKARIMIPENVSLVPIDFNREALGELLAAAGFERKQKTCFIWEGVTYYLDPESVDTTLYFVSQAAHPESTIAFDYTVSLADGDMNQYYGAESFAATMKEHHGDEALLFSIDPNGIEAFLAERNLRMVEHLDNQEIEKRFLTDERDSLIGPVTGHFRFVVAAARSK